MESSGHHMWPISCKAKYHKSQTVRARQLTFWENAHPLQHVTFHMSHVTCPMSHVTCHMSHVMCHMSYVACYLYIYFFFRTKWWSLSVKSLLSIGPTPSTFYLSLGWIISTCWGMIGQAHMQRRDFCRRVLYTARTHWPHYSCRYRVSSDSGDNIADTWHLTPDTWHLTPDT